MFDDDDSVAGQDPLRNDRTHAIRYVARAIIKAEEAERKNLTAIAAALDHGATLQELEEVTGYSVATLRRIAVRVRRSEKIEGRADNS